MNIAEISYIPVQTKEINKPNTRIMQILRKYIKVVSAFLLINFLFSTFLPTVSYALTSGPTAPEFTSFEPIDTTDMVNLQTGDFTYNIPLLEVPGPSGGYPLSLSYHAGIMPGEEASWVGLGWTLNPGAINRTVNGFADDHNGAHRKVIDDWEGGDRSTFSVGIGLPGASYGLSFSQDTYQGFGLGANMSAGLPINFGNSNAGFDVGISAGTNGYGQSYFGPNVGFSVGKALNQAKTLTGSIGLSTNFNSVSLGGGVGYRKGDYNQSVLGVSLSTSNRGSASASAAGFSANQVNSQAGSVQTDGIGITIPIPLGNSGLFLNLGYNYLRYWSHEESEVDTYGALYPGWNNPDDNAYDSFSLLDPDEEGGIVENDNADEVLGGSMPSYDQYHVSGQGIGGSIRPYAFERLQLYRQNVTARDDESNYILKFTDRVDPEGASSRKKLNFRFINDFSNQYSFSSNDDQKPHIASNSAGGLILDDLTPNFGKSGEQDGFDENNKRLAGSKHIEWVSNEEISDDNYAKKGLILNQNQEGWPTSKYDFDISKQIGAFVVTNENGMKYHYARPAYTYGEMIYTKTANDNNGRFTNERYQLEPYAYTWLLTAVTGPDYVDRNEDGIIDEGDWGYWVKFDYGMWSDQYVWRNPGVGFNKDLDQNFESFSTGNKEVYYLDMIKTKTHSALFVKNVRNDGKGSLKLFNDVVLNQELISADQKNGGYEPKRASNIVNSQVFHSWTVPVSTLKLDKVYLVKNEDLEDLTKINSEHFFAGNIYYNKYFNDDTQNENDWFPLDDQDNILDVTDVSEDIIAKSIRVVSLSTTTKADEGALCPETPNSFDYSNFDSNSNSNVANLEGKLTLQKLEFKGKGGQGTIPPMIFKYDLKNPQNGSSLIVKNGDQYEFNHSNSGLVEGDLIKLSNGAKDRYALISEISGSVHQLKILGRYQPFENQTYAWQQTKNPPYAKNHVDMWGFYKSDYVSLNNKNWEELVSSVSSKNTDVWSLRQIRSNIGSDISISYKSDEYATPQLYFNNILSISNLSIANGKMKMELPSLDNKGLVKKLTKSAFEITLLLKKNMYYSTTNNQLPCLPSSDHFIGFDQIDISIIPEDIESYDENSIIFRNQLLEDMFSVDENQYYVFDSNSSQCYVFQEWVDSHPIFEPTGVGYYPYTVTTWKSLKPDFCLGNIVVSGVKNYQGGGIKVEDISVHNPINNKITSTRFNFLNGVSSFEPNGLGVVDITELVRLKNSDSHVASQFNIEGAEKTYKKKMYNYFSELLANSRLLPAPGVMYQNVEVQEYVQKGDDNPIPSKGKVAYEFETFSADMIKRREIGDNHNTDHKSQQPFRSLAFGDHTAAIGRVNKITQYDVHGDRISETTNGYMDSHLDNGSKLYQIHNRQGIISEYFTEGRIVEFPDSEAHQSLLTLKEDFPNVQLNKTETNYKTGITTTLNNLSFDFYSGAVTSTSFDDGYGNRIETETVPAYKKYGGMGLAMIGGKNMLTQSAATYTYKIRQGSDRGLLSASLQTWDTNREDRIQVDGIPSEDLFVDRSGSITKFTGGYALHTSSEHDYTTGDVLRFVSDPYEVQSEYGPYMVTDNYLVEVGHWDVDRSNYLLISNGNMSNIFASKPGTFRLEIPINGIWRKDATYAFKGAHDINLTADGLYIDADEENDDHLAFSSWLVSDPSDLELWNKTSEITLYDHYSHTLEATDINGNYAATKMDNKQEKVLATIANASYDEFAYSGAEDWDGTQILGGEVTWETGIILSKEDQGYETHTGDKVMGLVAGNKGFSFTSSGLVEGRKYKVSVWSDKEGCDFYTKNGSDPEQLVTGKRLRQSDGWFLHEAHITPPEGVSEFEIYCQASEQILLDDFRVHPIDAPMTAYVYNEYDELTFVLDNNNLFTEYQYDDMGRLKSTYRESFKYGRKKVNEYTVHYSANPNENN